MAELSCYLQDRTILFLAEEQKQWIKAGLKELNRFDKDGNGYLDREEIKAYIKAKLKEDKTASEEAMQKHFQSLDADNDGRLTQKEYIVETSAIVLRFVAEKLFPAEQEKVTSGVIISYLGTGDKKDRKCEMIYQFILENKLADGDNKVDWREFLKTFFPSGKK